MRTVDVADAERARFSLADADVEALARQALLIEEHYGCPMDIEWGKDGDERQLYILQARPETVQSRTGRIAAALHAAQPLPVLAEGRSIGARIGSGPARMVARRARAWRWCSLATCWSPT